MPPRVTGPRSISRPSSDPLDSQIDLGQSGEVPPRPLTRGLSGEQHHPPTARPAGVAEQSVGCQTRCEQLGQRSTCEGNEPQARVGALAPRGRTGGARKAPLNGVPIGPGDTASQCRHERTRQSLALCARAETGDVHGRGGRCHRRYAAACKREGGPGTGPSLVMRAGRWHYVGGLPV